MQRLSFPARVESTTNKIMVGRSSWSPCAIQCKMVFNRSTINHYRRPLQRRDDTDVFCGLFLWFPDTELIFCCESRITNVPACNKRARLLERSGRLGVHRVLRFATLPVGGRSQRETVAFFVLPSINFTFGN